MKSAIFVLACVCALSHADAEPKTVKLSVPSVGEVSVVCADPGGWRVSAAAKTEAGADVVTVELASDREARPPEFEVGFSFPGADVHHVWTPDYDKRFTLWPSFWPQSSGYVSQLASESPLLAALNSNDESVFSMAASEAFEKVVMTLGADARTCEIRGGLRFFSDPVPPRKSCRVSVRLDRRRLFWGDAVRTASDWVAAQAGFVAAPVPEAAYDPLYSTWYAYLQEVRDRPLEREARLAHDLGMRTMILDDGWQMPVARDTYDMTGDWQPATNRFPDMRGHVAAVRREGMRYMLWLAVPFVGERSAAWRRFRGKTLTVKEDGADGGKVAVLDPRFPEVREYLASTYERVVGEWGFDGVKLDFIDEFVRPDPDPAEKEDFAGRDIRGVPQAVDVLMKDVLRRLRAINPDVLVEFRQHYSGPAIRQYGNMIRALDCPADFTSNRRRICDLRLTCGRTAVHSDMLVWSADETPSGAAKPILSAIFGVIQYSMVLQTIPAAQREVIRHWLKFSQEHREALLKGEFRPHRPDLGYPFVEAQSASERIQAVYLDSWLVRTGAPDRPVCVINATDARELALRLDAAARIEGFDAVGRPAGTVKDVPAGLATVAVPPGGYVRITWRIGE